MRAVRYLRKGEFAVVDAPRPELRDPKDAVVRVTMASICTSDLHIRDGHVPRAVPGTIVGHEFVGIVDAVGAEVTNVSVGDRVAVCVETFCGSCFYCERGWVNNCTDPDGGWALGCRIDGGQAEYVRVPHADTGLDRIPDNVTDGQALLVGDILATGYWAAGMTECGAGDVVAVIGAGPVGVCTAVCLKRLGVRTVMIDIDESRLSFSKEHGVGDIHLNPKRDDVISIIKGMTDGRGADAVVEAAGGKGTFDDAWRCARPNGIVCLVAMYGEPESLPLSDMYGKNLVFKTGGVDASKDGEILALISKGEIDVSFLLTHRFPFSRVEEAYELFESGGDGVMKVALTFE